MDHTDGVPQSGSSRILVGVAPDGYRRWGGKMGENGKRPDRCRPGRLRDDRSSAPIFPLSPSLLAA